MIKMHGTLQLDIYLLYFGCCSNGQGLEDIVSFVDAQICSWDMLDKTCTLSPACDTSCILQSPFLSDPLQLLTTMDIALDCSYNYLRANPQTDHQITWSFCWNCDHHHHCF